MDADKKYTVMELAELIGVPRTTINDWLNRYAQYIDSQAQGKRKVYPESAVGVLREIAEYRNSGKAFPEIETELSARHPIRAVPVPPAPEPAPSAPKTSDNPVPMKEEKPEVHPNQEFAVIARQQSEEIGRLIGESFRSMDKRIQELENISAAQRKMSFFWLSAFALFLIFLIAGGFMSWHYIDRARQENRFLQQRQVENTEKLTALKEQSVSLIAGSKAFQANIARLESELQEQKAGFEKSIREENRRLNELHQAKEKALSSERDQALAKVREQETRLALEKEKFAAERLKLLKELEQLKAAAGQPAQTSKTPVQPPAGKAEKPETVPAKPEKTKSAGLPETSAGKDAPEKAASAPAGKP